MLFRPACAFAFLALSGFAAEAFRPPAVPLVTVDPYFSVWSMADHLTDAPTKHWTGKPQPLTSMIRIDGASYRLMGVDRQIPAMHQLSLDVEPTRTIYDFEDHGIRVELTFMTPLLPH
ncbi:MAG TPA: DUF4964 domain-containing protein, partial [Bryobacteraceae bacterium]|nr:DUF4964 domain-containing protein [Bryobacteraceae bacterium]